ncbi:hypothetical protein BDV38DRAFT_254505 [Aspergillus pseudotamarii]|uniref:Uncharacterized protein n=1 Tax=Aspergillus pseudotamarii TaxID=132259 RepID=A0A5N6SLW1_ASPPS|nr:uncharacterized protein BDV38DRAFT_254505 [Aspergillus pseudotamarii]KAE8134681.1 hypothetical protein BDV38DRAFT_254505 [Aspergillus pseudotamarii]
MMPSVVVASIPIRTGTIHWGNWIMWARKLILPAATDRVLARDWPMCVAGDVLCCATCQPQLGGDCLAVYRVPTIDVGIFLVAALIGCGSCCIR